jgi:alkylation response protein AidB-like acyl-CoA dehydrogenase
VDFALPSEVVALQEEAVEVARRAAADRPVKEDAWIIGNSPEFSAELGERGWLGMTWPTEFGGGGRSPLERFVVVEALISNGAPMASSWMADRQIGPSLFHYGTDEQRRRFLPGILAGTAMWGIGMSEPDAGSDVAAIRTSAVRDGDVFIVNGQKIWTSGAADADWLYLVARTSTEGRPHEGLSDLIVDMHAEGITIKPIVDLTANRHFCEVFFEDVRVPVENLVGQLNGSFKQVMRQMEHERGGIDRLVSNRALYLDTLERLDGASALDRQAVARFETGYTVGRHMVLREVMGQAPPGWSAITKTFCTEMEIEVANWCGSVAGPEAMLANRVSRAITYAPGYTIQGGTTQVLRNIMGERVLGLPREPRGTG